MHICELKYRMRWPGTIYNIVIKKVSKYKTDELRNQTFVCTLKVRNVMKLLKCVLSRGPRLVESFVHYENVTNQKIKVTMQTTTKKSFLTISV